MSSSDMDDMSSIERTPSPPTDHYRVNGTDDTFSEEEIMNNNNNVNKINDSDKQNSSYRKPPPSTKLFILPMSSTKNKQKSPPEKPFKPPQYQKQDSNSPKTLQEVLASTSTKTVEKSFHISEDEVINERQAVLESLKPKTKRLNSWVLAQKLEQENGDGGVVAEHVYDPHQLDELQQYTVKLETEQDDPFFPKESHKAYEERRIRQKREEEKRREGIVVALKPRATGEVESQSYLKQKRALKALWEERMIAEQQEQERDLPPLININQSNPPLHEAQTNGISDDESDTRGKVVGSSPEPREDMNVEFRERQYSGDNIRHTYKTGWDIMQEELREMKQREQELRSQRLRATGANNARGCYPENQEPGNTQELRPNSTLELRRRFEQMTFQTQQQ